ncbi:hypothetical protein F5Y11DRAFT_334926 [Daldinia sp. FL1419]|nr:hypothetical protein F5Y11DRAFT_334926 [Daldinia sp. FL1419]
MLFLFSFPFSFFFFFFFFFFLQSRGTKYGRINKDIGRREMERPSQMEKVNYIMCRFTFVNTYTVSAQVYV